MPQAESAVLLIRVWMEEGPQPLRAHIVAQEPTVAPQLSEYAASVDALVSVVRSWAEAFVQASGVE